MYATRNYSAMSIQLHTIPMNSDLSKKGVGAEQPRPVFDPRQMMGSYQPNPYLNMNYSYMPSHFFPSQQVVQLPQLLGLSTPTVSNYNNAFPAALSSLPMMTGLPRGPPIGSISAAVSGLSSLSSGQAQSPEQEGGNASTAQQPGGRVRSTLQMTNFLASQMRRYNFFKTPKNKEERLQVRRNWERALAEFNDKFELSVGMTAYRRKVSHLRRTTTSRQLVSERDDASDSDIPHVKSSKNVELSSGISEEEEEEEDEDTSGNDDGAVSTPPPNDRKKAAIKKQFYENNSSG